MGLWSAVVIIVAIGTLSELYRARLKSQASKSDVEFDKLADRMTQLETRMANLETIVLDREKAERFATLRD